MNLLQETSGAVEESGYTPDDIIFIGSEFSGHSCSWEEFTTLANRDYDDGYGAQIVADDLIIVFSDNAKLRRHEYDGNEGWRYDSPFKMPEERKPIKHLFADEVGRVGWVPLADLNL